MDARVKPAQDGSRITTAGITGIPGGVLVGAENLYMRELDGLLLRPVTADLSDDRFPSAIDRRIQA